MRKAEASDPSDSEKGSSSSDSGSDMSSDEGLQSGSEEAPPPRGLT